VLPNSSQILHQRRVKRDQRFPTQRPQAGGDPSRDSKVIVRRNRLFDACASAFTPITRLETKKTDVAERPEAFDHVGLLVIGPPSSQGCPSISHPTTSFAMYAFCGGTQMRTTKTGCPEVGGPPDCWPRPRCASRATALDRCSGDCRALPERGTARLAGPRRKSPSPYAGPMQV
jgi:hypothetical protein